MFGAQSSRKVCESAPHTVCVFQIADQPTALIWHMFADSVGAILLLYEALKSAMHPAPGSV